MVQAIVMAVGGVPIVEGVGTEGAEGHGGDAREQHVAGELGNATVLIRCCVRAPDSRMRMVTNFMKFFRMSE